MKDLVEESDMARSAFYENLFIVETLEDELEEISLKAVIQARAVRAFPEAGTWMEETVQVQLRRQIRPQS